MASSSDAPNWREFTKETLDAIEAKRQAARQNPVQRKAGTTYGLVCPACDKPNAPEKNYCTGCMFELRNEDLQALPDNVFMGIIRGTVPCTLHYRDEEILAFDDKFGVSDHHLDIIPIKEIADITVLTREHIPLVERIYEIGLYIFKSRNIPCLKGRDIEEHCAFGYNWPVSVKHLHQHSVAPPFRHEKVFDQGGPRWHPYRKVLNDLKEFGYVRTYDKYPNPDECKAEYERLMALHRTVLSDQ